MAREKSYPSDLSDEEWNRIRANVGGFWSGPDHDYRREILNAIIYANRTGNQWAYMPHDLPNGEDVHGCFLSWRRNGWLGKIQGELPEGRISLDGQPHQDQSLNKIFDAQKMIMDLQNNHYQEILKRLSVRTEYLPCEHAFKADRERLTVRAYKRARDLIRDLDGGDEVHIYALNYHLEAEADARLDRRFMRDLRRVVSGIYSDQARARIVMYDLNMPEGRVDFGKDIDAVWYSCLREFECCSDGIRNLLTYVREHYKNHHEVGELWARYESATAPPVREERGGAGLSKSLVDLARDEYYDSILTQLKEARVHGYHRVLQHPDYRQGQQIRLRENYRKHYQGLLTAKEEYQQLYLHIAPPIYPISFVLVERRTGSHLTYPHLILQIDQLKGADRHEVAGYLFLHEHDSQEETIQHFRFLFKAVRDADGVRALKKEELDL